MFCSRLNPWRSLVCVLLMMLASWTASAQTQQTTPVIKPKAGPESCDGALDVVPNKSATFVRKRRAPGKKPAPKTELKPENKSSL